MVRLIRSTMTSNLLALEVSVAWDSRGEHERPVLVRSLAHCLFCSHPQPQKSHSPYVLHPSEKVLVGAKGENSFWNISSFQTPDQVSPSHPSLRTLSQIQQRNKRKSEQGKQHLLSICCEPASGPALHTTPSHSLGLVSISWMQSGAPKDAEPRPSHHTESGRQRASAGHTGVVPRGLADLARLSWHRALMPGG